MRKLLLFPVLFVFMQSNSQTTGDSLVKIPWLTLHDTMSRYIYIPTNHIWEREVLYASLKNKSYKFKLKEHIAPALCIVLAGISEGIMDGLDHHYDKSDQFWNPDLSYLNKYKDRDVSKGKTFRGKYLIFTTDGWHLMKFSRNLFTMGAIATKISISGKKRWYVYVLEGLSYWALNRLSFTITYNYF